VNLAVEQAILKQHKVYWKLTTKGKTMIKNSVFKAMLLILFFVLSTHAQSDLSPKQKELVRSVFNVDFGYIDEKLYNDFWQGKNTKINSKDLVTFKKILLFSQKHQLQTQLDAKKSIALEKPYFSKTLKKSLADMKKMSYYKTAYDNTIKYIEHAASGELMVANGQKFYVNIDVIEKVLSGLNASIERIELLFSKTWNPIFKERVFNKNINVLWHLPFKKEKVIVDNLNSTTYSSIIDLDNIVNVTIVEGSEKRKIDKISTNNCIKGISSKVGNSKPIIVENKFRGYKNSSTSFKLSDANGGLFVDVKCISYKKTILSLVTMSSSAIDGGNIMDLISKNLRLK